MTDRPVAILAWTLKGWRLPFAGDPLNHGAQLTGEQLGALRRELGVPENDEWAPFPPDSAEGRFVRHAMAQGIGLPRRFRPPPAALIPDRLDLPPRPTTSTQEAFGDVLAALGRQPGLDSALLTVSADVTTTTHLSGWVNRRGVYATGERDDAFERHGLRPLIRWKESPPASTSSWGSGRRRSSCSCRSWVWLRALRPAAAPDRHAVRLLPAARLGSPAPRHVLEGALHPRGESLRHQPRPRGRRAPVGPDARPRDRGARISSPTSRRSPARWSGRSWRRSA